MKNVLLLLTIALISVSCTTDPTVDDCGCKQYKYSVTDNEVTEVDVTFTACRPNTDLIISSVQNADGSYDAYQIQCVENIE